jgi:hypothetical protein
LARNGTPKVAAFRRGRMSLYWGWFAVPNLFVTQLSQWVD